MVSIFSPFELELNKSFATQLPRMGYLEMSRSIHASNIIFTFIIFQLLSLSSFKTPCLKKRTPIYSRPCATFVPSLSASRGLLPDSLTCLGGRL